MNKTFVKWLISLLISFFSGQTFPLTVIQLYILSVTLVYNSQATGYGVMALITTTLKELTLQSTTQCQNNVHHMMMLL